MSGLLSLFTRWPHTTRGSALTTGTWIRGKNGKIYKIVDIVHTTTETLITTFHELDGQESFSVTPGLRIEYLVVPEGAERPVEMETSNANVKEVGRGVGGEEPPTTVSTGRRASTTGKEMFFLMTGEQQRRVVSEYAIIAPNYTQRKPEKEEEKQHSMLSEETDVDLEERKFGETGVNLKEREFGDSEEARRGNSNEL